MSGKNRARSSATVYRTYRRNLPGLYCFRVSVGETDLWVEASWDCKREIEGSVRRLRIQLRDFIDRNPAFRTTLKPWDPKRTVGNTPEIAAVMIEAASKADVGPMASVAGAIAGLLGKELAREGETLIIENGGDIFLASPSERIIGIFAGASPFSQKIGLRIRPALFPLGVCTSAGTVGPSLSFGKADAVVVLAPEPALADAAATAIGNRVRSAADLEKAAAWARTIPGLLGILIIIGPALTAWGEIEILPVCVET